MKTRLRGGVGRPDDWVLLLEFNLHMASSGGAAVFWTIQRDDLVARRFDRAQVVLDYNP
ncbi:hypothetical protein [Umezawaea sp. Da 62-37]|uniref:hypothetical protein n=1 Tax=Umezawaea sp. Da 62-37 TaxID=3075927 RepID=UPI0028F6DE31|nr:hypothetical protein [Umezawaea sp. Da 62-37]WNV88044.1 hypothetical protein RM788_07075 [Umezawaea sp. Da 62-37]